MVDAAADLPLDLDSLIRRTILDSATRASLDTDSSEPALLAERLAVLERCILVGD